MKKVLLSFAALSVLSAAETNPATSSGSSFGIGPSTDKKSQLSQSDRDAPHGKGPYYLFSTGFGIKFVSVSEADSATVGDDVALNKFTAAASLNVGYTHRFENNFVFGGEVVLGYPIIMPRAILGYMLGDNDQLALGVGYNTFAKIISSKKESKDLDGISGIGFGVDYQHFFSNGSLVRFSLLGEYYGNAGKNLSEIDKSISLTKGATVLPVTVAIGFGMQW